ncbi:partitioning defective 6 homolog gamma [Orycteropus afer afer]|uniref:Partitioning defective 6 homolog gamma n=1 Tax=Orycteropus afer afer TaxID=1230840 RepID=A0A8B7AV63_ORYAF|nr:partitioning defective 6 homolog gamma [Orycteropus afer afer]
MNRSFHKSQTLRFYDCSAVEVKSKFGAEFRRFSLDRHRPGRFEDFYQLVVHTHRLASTDVTIGYADVHGDLLPINNDDNFSKAVSSACPLLRVFVQKRAQSQGTSPLSSPANSSVLLGLWDLTLSGSGREGNGSIHRLLSSLKDPRHSLALPPGGVEEHGPAVTL